MTEPTRDELLADRQRLTRKLALYRARIIEAFGHDVLECGGLRLCQKCRDGAGATKG